MRKAYEDYYKAGSSFTTSSDDEPEVPANPFEKSQIPIGKNVDFANFTIKAPTLYIEKYFKNMGWVLIATLEENDYPHLMKEFYKSMIITPRTDGISC